MLQFKCPSMAEWINQIWYIHTMVYYSAIKRNEVLTYAVTWMNLEKLRLSEINLTQKFTYYMIPFIGNVQDR